MVQANPEDEVMGSLGLTFSSKAQGRDMALEAETMVSSRQEGGLGKRQVLSRGKEGEASRPRDGTWPWRQRPW